MSYDHLFPEWEDSSLILLGAESQATTQKSQGFAPSPDLIREQLYQLASPHIGLKMADLGNLKERAEVTQTAEVLAFVLKKLIDQKKTVLILGGSSQLNLGVYEAYRGFPRLINYTSIDAYLRCQEDLPGKDQQSFLRQFLTNPELSSFQCHQLGFQKYLNPVPELEWAQAQQVFPLRYGELQANLETAEPALRKADLVSFDLSALRSESCPGSWEGSPGGFDVMEACRLARYAGLGYQVNSFFLSGLAPAKDLHGRSAQLAALLIYYFLEGRHQRWDDQPSLDRKNLRHYSVRLHASVEHIDFFQHHGTGRWWMEVPFPDNLDQRQADQKLLIPCSQGDYELARTDEIPPRWWTAYQRLTEIESGNEER
ncbi:MAG: arginase family protein, partial [Bacteroidota bacterium]